MHNLNTKWRNYYESMLEDCQIDYDTIKKYVYKYMPNKLYRYRDFNEYSEDNILKGEVHFSFASDFNDPFDAAIKLNFDKIEKELEPKKYIIELVKQIPQRDKLYKCIQKKIFEEFQKYIKIACFSEYKDSMLMWSHYANYHKGFCIEYDTSKSELFEKYMLPIIYKKDRYDATKCFLTKNKNIGVNPVLYKSNVWEYEKEWRMFDYASNFEEGKDFMVLKDAITAIYLGACMKENEEDRVRRWAKKKEIVVYKMKLDDETYKLTCKNI